MRKTANCKVKRTVNRGYMVRERQPPWMTQGSKHEIKSEKADQEEDKEGKGIRKTKRGIPKSEEE